MPPRRKRGRKNATQTIRKSPKIQTFSDDDEDIFEMPKLRSQVKTEPTSTSSQTKSSCQSKRLLRTVAAKATSNGISDETKKHVDKNCKMASNSAKNNNDIEISVSKLPITSIFLMALPFSIGFLVYFNFVFVCLT